jgi:hypothetical protein
LFSEAGIEHISMRKELQSSQPQPRLPSHLHNIRFGAAPTSISTASPPDHIGGSACGYQPDFT